MTTDVLIVGSGAAGAMAAIEAASAAADARVLVLEALPDFGGAAATSGGGTCIAGTPLQQSLGLNDSPTLAFEDWLAFGGPDADAAWAERYLQAGPQELFAWLASIGVDWTHVTHQEGNRAPRWHAPRGGGAGLMRAVEAHARSLPIEWQFERRVVDLIVEGGRVVGVVAAAPDGSLTEYRATAVLIASGGFNSDPEMVQRYAAGAARGGRVLLGGGKGATGGGHRLLERIGADFVNLDVIWMYPYGTPDPADPQGLKGLVLRGLDGELWLNQQGARFHNESLRGGASGTPALLAQDPPMCWSVIDARIGAAINIADPYYRLGADPHRERTWELLNTSPFIRHANTLEQLADAIGVERAALTGAVTQHNTLVQRGEDKDAFGRPLAGLQPLETPPFYAIQFFPLARKNFGGVRTDLDCQVLRPDGSSIPGLFAAGEVAGMAGGHINGHAGLEGTMLGPSLYSGRVAGRAMVGAGRAILT